MAKQLNVNLAMTADTSKAKIELQALQKQLDNLMMSAQRKDSSLGLSSEIQKATQMAAQLKVQLESATSSTGKLDLTKFNEGLQKSGLKLSDYRAALSSLGPEGSQAFSKLASSIMQAEVPLRRSNALLSNFATTLKNTARWQISSSVLHGFMGALQGAYGYAQDLNESLNNIRIVTSQSIDQMAKFADEANRAAKALSTSTTAYTDAALIYYQQGLNDQAVKERTDVTIKLANVSRQSAEEVSSQMTAIWNNFDNGSKSLEYYADVITKLGAATASSSDEIAQGLQKFASVADTVGLSYEKATAALATVVAETRQSADVVGTAFKTMFARFQGLQLGETLEDGVTLNKYSEAINTVGVNILKANGDLKDMDTILDELGEKWNSIGEAQKVALAETVAGTRQYAQFMAIMNNYDKILANQNLAANSEGTLQEQADIYAESWEAARKRVRAASQAIYQDLLDDKFFIKLLNWLEKTLSFLDKFIDNIGGLKGVLLTLGSVLTSVFSAQIQTSINNMVSSIAMMTPKGQKSAESLRAQANKELFAMTNSPELQGTAQGGAMTEAYKQQANLQGILLDNAKYMTEEEQKQAQLLLDMNRRMGEEAIAAGKTADELERQTNELGKQQSEQARRTAANTNHTYSAEDIIIAQDDVKKMTASMQAVSSATAAFESITKKIPENLDLSEKETQELYNVLKQIGQTKLPSLENLKGTLVDLNNEDLVAKLEFAFDSLGDSIEDIDNPEVFQSIINDIIQISQELKDSLPVDLQIQLEDAEGKLSQAYRKAGMNAQEAGNAAGQYSDACQRSAQASQDAADKTTLLGNSAQQSGEKIKQLGQYSVDFGSVMSTLSSTIMGVASAINAFKSIGNIWNDEDATTGERILQILMSIGMILPALNNMTKIQTLLNGLFAKSAVAAGAGAQTMAAGETAAAAAGTAMKIALWEVYLIIGAVVAIGYILVKVFDAIKEASPAGQLKKATEIAKELLEAFDEAKNKANELKSTFDTYDSVIQKLKECKNGTEEWKEALEEVRRATADVLQKYPELQSQMEFSYINGVRIITNLEDIYKKAENKANNLQLTSIMANARVASAQLESDRYDIQKKYVTAGNLYSGYGMGERDAKIGEMLANLDQYTGLTRSEFAKFNDVLGLSEKDLRNFQDALEELKRSTEDVNDRVKDASLTITNEILQNSNFTKNAENNGVDAFAGVISEKITEQASPLFNKSQAAWADQLRFIDREQLFKDYLELTGDNYNLKKIKNGNYITTDSEGNEKTISIDSVIQALASNRASDAVQTQLEKMSDNLINFVKNQTGQFSLQNKDLITNLLLGQLENINPEDFKNMQLTDSELSAFAQLLNEFFGEALDVTDPTAIQEYISNHYSLSSVYRSQIKDISSLQENIKNLNKAFGSLKFGDVVESLEGLSEHAKSYFQIMEDGTYKLVGNVQGFKDALFKESTVGFEENLQNYIGLFVNQEINEAGTAGARSLGLISSGQAIIGEGEEAHVVNDYETMQANAVGYAMATDSLEQLEYVKERLNEISIDTKTQTLAENAALQDLASKYESCTDDLEAYQHALESGNDELAAAARETLKYSIAVAELAEKHGFDAKETEAYAKRLKNNLSAAMKEAGFSEKQLEKSALTAAIANQRLDRGLLSLNKNLETYKKSLSSADKNSIEWSNTMEALKTDLADILNMDTSVLTDEFAEGLLTDATYSAYLTQALDGNVEAIKKLREIAADNMMSNIEDNLVAAGEKVTDFTEQWNAFKLSLAENLKTGGLDQTELVNAFNDLIQKGHMTKDQIEAALSGLNVAADIETTYHEQDTTIPTTITEEYTESAGEGTYWTYDDEKKTNVPHTVPLTRRISRTYQGAPVTAKAYVPTYKIKGTTGSGSATTKIVKPASIPKGSIQSYTDTGTGNNSPNTSANSNLVNSHTDIGAKTSNIVTDAFSPLVNEDNGINFIQPSYGSTTTGIKDGEKDKGGGSEKEATGQAELIEDEEHRYDELNKTLQGLSQQYERLGKARDRAWGKNKIALLEQEMQKLKQMQQTYERYLKTVAGDDWEKLAKTLGSGGNLGSLIAKGQAGGNLQKDYNKIVTSMADAIQYITKDEKGNQQRKTIEWQGLAEMLHMDIILDEFGQIANRDDIEEALEAWWNEHVLEWDRHNTDPQWQEEHDTFLQEAEAIREYAEKLLNQYDDSINVFTENYDKWMDNMYEQQAKACY